MSNKERGSNPHKITHKEKKALKERVQELTGWDKSQSFSSTVYRKDDIIVELFANKKIGSATIIDQSTPPDDYGHTMRRRRNLHMTTKTDIPFDPRRKLEIIEELNEYDSQGIPVSWWEPGVVQRSFERWEQEEALGLNKVTKEQYEETMSLLSTLTPDDETPNDPRGMSKEPYTFGRSKAEIRQDDTSEFQPKVIELMRNPKIKPEAPGLFVAQYRKDNVDIAITLPRPDHEFQYADPHNAIHVVINEEVETEQGERSIKTQDFVMDLTYGWIRQREGRIPEGEEQIKDIKEQNINGKISKGKYEEVMSLLNSLTPDDEVL